MAKPACTFCEVNEGVLMDTNLDDGDTNIVCGPCLPGYALGLAAALTKGMTGEQAEAYGETLDAIYGNDPRGIWTRPAGRKRKPKAEPSDRPQCGVCKQYDGRHATWCTGEAAVVPDGRADGVPQHVALREPCPLCGSESAIGDAEKLTCAGCGAIIATAGAPAGGTG